MISIPWALMLMILMWANGAVVTYLLVKGKEQQEDKSG